MMKGTFEQQVSDFTNNTEKKILAVVRDAVSSIAEQANTPKSKGGRMPVDTGFLRASAIGALNQIPSGPTEGRRRGPLDGERGTPLKEYAVIDTSPLNIVLGKMKIGDSVFFGWTARYAKYREVHDAFLETALQNWKGIVNVSIRKFQR